MATTTNLNISLVEQNQAQKEITVNAALVRVDALLNRGVLDKDVATPPGSPSDGDMYIVAASATGNWTGFENQLAYYEQLWRFISPNEGMTVWVNDEDRLYTFDGAEWVPSVNLSSGTATLASGTATVANTSITANTNILLTSEGSSTGVLRISSRIAGTSFTITSTDAGSSDIVHWLLVE